jgi:AP-1 complex subunit sigma 1/2
MKYLSLRTFEDVSSALNFESDGTRVVGGCDLYTTKAGTADKKLYKRIDKTLESQHESLLRLAASLSPPQAKLFAKTSNLSQSSPFGTLSQISNRRTYAYMISTLNASHPDYDFSKVLRPSDFCREKRLNDVMNNVDSKMYSAHSARIPRGLQTPGGSLMWGPRMWSFINDEMDLYNCDIFSYKPDENPFDDEEIALWSTHYFFFNKTLKRVCYLYVRALSPSFPDEPEEEDDLEAGAATPVQKKRKQRQSADFSARKRARYWLGDRADDLEEEWDEEAAIIQRYDDDSEEDDIDVEILEEIEKRGRSMSSNMSEDSEEPRSKSHVLNMHDAIAEAIEL